MASAQTYKITKLELIDGRKFTFIDEEEVKYEYPGMDIRKLNYYNLKTGKLIVDLEKFNGIMFLDNHNNFYDTFTKKIYFNDRICFEGESDKEAFSLFDNFDKLELKIKEAIDKINKESDIKEKQKIENNIYAEIKKEFENFNLNKVLLKSGKFIYSDRYDYIHDNILEEYRNNEKISEGEFIQKIKDNTIEIIPFGKTIFYNNDIEYFENFYGYDIGRYKYKDKLKEEFGFSGIFIEFLKALDIKDNINKYEIGDERVTLEIINNKTRLVKILVKDPRNINIIYEINTKLNNKNELKDKLVIDHRTGEMLLVNYNNYIISSDIFKDIPIFSDESEFNMYKNNVRKNINNLEDAKRLIENKSNIKNEILKIKEILNNDNSIEKIAEGINRHIIEKKIKFNGIKDQQYSGECWVYSLSKIIVDTNARKYGRKLEDFNKIYNTIIKKYSKDGKKIHEIDKIMQEELKNFDLKYAKIEDENFLKKNLKNGIRCLTTFYLSKKEWKNFSNFCDNFKKGQILTKEVLEQQNNFNIENPDETDGHAVILSDIDEEGNYTLINSWGEKWGDNGTFKVKKECLKESTFFEIYFDDNTDEEKNAWNKLKNDIKQFLNELNIIRCPKCERWAKIEQFEIVNQAQCQLRCPYQEKCIFEFNNDENKYAYILEQLIYYNPYDEKGGFKRFDYGFDYGINY